VKERQPRARPNSTIRQRKTREEKPGQEIEDYTYNVGEKKTLNKPGEKKLKVKWRHKNRAQAVSKGNQGALTKRAKANC